jgi:predicted TIM-barrel fold metal-dependent hydrolase
MHRPARRKIASVRKLDVFNHIYPAAYFDRMLAVAPHYKDIGKRMRNVPMLVDLDVRFAVMDRFEGYQQVLSIATPPIEVYAAPRDAIDLARIANDGMAELVTRHPDRFPAFVASLPLGDPEASLRELHRAIDDLGARGVQIFSNINGRPLDAPQFLPLFEAMAGYDLPLWLHPFRGADSSDYATESRSQYEIWWALGWPYDTSAAMARLVFAGIFDRFPALKIITHHMGAMAPYFEGRLGPGLDQLGVRTSDEDLGAVLRRLKKRPLEYFKMFYADTALFGAYDATVCGLKFFGVDRVLFASDAPFDPERGPMFIRETIRIVDELPISDVERERIYWRNAVDLLRLN